MRTFVLACFASALAFVSACGPSPQGDTCTGSDCPDGGAPATQCDDPGATQACYTGTVGTDGVGPCHGGTRTCLNNGSWSQCEGQVLPGADVCGNGQDENCDGTADNPTDEDGDGFTNCGGDCCDSTDEGCQQPERVNPGAIEVDGNMLDDDCDGTADNATAQPLCDSGLNSNSGNAMDYAKAMDLCAETTENDPHWGVISARFLKADGTGAPLPDQRSIRPDYGSTMVQNGQSLVVLSTTNAAATAHNNPAPSDNGYNNALGAGSGYPADWLAANGNTLPNAPNCPGPVGGTANDPVMLELKIKTPTNASSFSMRVNFMSAEYPEYTCTAFNDFFVVLLDSGWNGTPANPADKNLAIYTAPNNQVYPVGVNLASGNTGLFPVCRNGVAACRGFPSQTITTCTSNTELVGTGLEVVDDSCGDGSQVGGGTGWLTTSGNVNGGEIVTLRIALWDTSDGDYDSVAMVDNFQWSLTPSEPGTVIDVD